MKRRLPPFRYYLYVLGTVNAVMALVLVGASLVFSSGVDVVALAFVVLVVNVVGMVSVFRQA